MEDDDDFRLTAVPLALKAKAHAAKVEEQSVSSEILVLVCHCRSFRHPHFLEAHELLRDEWDWRTPEEREAEEKKK